MACFICTECGTQFAESEVPPPGCQICEDVRQNVRWDGQAWTTLEDLRRTHRMRFEEEAPGITGIGATPSFAIGQRALLVEDPDGNVLWDCMSLIDDDIVAAVERKGGLKAVAISHPHFYTTMVAWSEAFGGIPIYVHADDSRWVQRPHKAIVPWQGETHALSSSLTLIRCGGHFDGSTVLHCATGAGAILSGDTIQVTQDRKFVSFMYSYPNIIPLNRRAVSTIASALAPYRFDNIFGAWWRRNIIGGAHEAFERSVERYLAAIA